MNVAFFTSPIGLLAIALAVGAVIFFIRFRRPRPQQIGDRIRVLFRTQAGQMQWREGVISRGILTLPGYGSYSHMLPGCMTFRRWGTMFWPVSADRAEVMRSRELFIAFREGDASPLYIGAGWAKKYRGPTLDPDMVQTIQSTAHAIAESEAMRSYSLRDHTTNMLAIGVVLSVIGVVVVWGAVAFKSAL